MWFLFLLKIKTFTHFIWDFYFLSADSNFSKIKFQSATLIRQSAWQIFREIAMSCLSLLWSSYYGVINLNFILENCLIFMFKENVLAFAKYRLRSIRPVWFILKPMFFISIGQSKNGPCRIGCFSCMIFEFKVCLNLDWIFRLFLDRWDYFPRAEFTVLKADRGLSSI